MWIANAIVCVKKCMEGGNESIYFYLHKKTLEKHKELTKVVTPGEQRAGKHWMGMTCESGFSMHSFDIVDTFRSLCHVNILPI